jgi:guanylate kinase
MNHSTLKHYQEFKDVLATYMMSERAKKALEGLQLILLVAPTSTGRNTVIHELQKQKGEEYHFIVSDTTRAPQVRDGKLEENGVIYFFRTEEEMLTDLRAGEFLEAALIHEQQVSGISVRELEKAKNLNKIAITDIEIQGTDNVMRAKPDAKAIFLLPPSFDEWQDRMASRGRMSEHELRNRLRSAATEFDAALNRQYYNYVIAENVPQTAAIIDAIAHSKPNPYQGRGVSLIHQLQDRLQQKLASNPV